MLPRALTVLLASVAVSGCGNERTAPPNVDRALAPDAQRVVKIEKTGIRYRVPDNWADLQVAGRRVGGIRSGRATLAVWRYPRREDLPEDRADLRQVRDLLVDRVEERDETFDLDRSRLTRRGGAPAIELLGTQTIAGQRVRVRSVHAYANRAEVVIDAYAPPAEFARVDRAVFRPLIRSLRLRRVK